MRENLIPERHSGKFFKLGEVKIYEPDFLLNLREFVLNR